MTIFVILAVCAAVFLILARPFRDAPPPPSVPESGSMASSDRTTRPAPTEASHAPPTVQLHDGRVADLPEDLARVHLLDEKDRIFQALADLRFDHEAGKLSREDYEDEDARLRARAAGLLHDLERYETP